MNIGDKVRSMAGNEEGIVVRFMDGNQVEVEIDGGFRIPFIATELVVISSSEGQYFGEKPQTKEVKKAAEKAKTLGAEKGLFLAFKHRNDKLLEVYFINNTDAEILFTFGESSKDKYSGVASGRLTKRNYHKINEVNLDAFERWGAFVFQILHFKRGQVMLKEPLIKKMRFKASTFSKSKREAPILAEECYLFQLDEQLKALDVKELAENMLGSQSASELEHAFVKAKTQVKRPSESVDLHAETLLGKQFDSTPKDKLLEIQLNAFEVALDNAILSGMDHITFIHGVGNGVLKNELQKRLSRNEQVKFYQDAQKGKFGYGATAVTFK